jgi:prophage tail gpP-like protein
MRQLVSPFKLTIQNHVNTDVRFKDFKLQTGESPWDAINRANEFEGALIISDSLGRVIVTKPGLSADIVTDKLVYGQNILSAQMDIDYSGRFSEYTVKGQTKVKDNSGWGSERQVNFKASAEDPDIADLRFRPKIFQAEGQATQAAAQKRVDLEASVRAAKSAEFRVTVRGWRQSNKALWPINQFVLVNYPPAQLFNRRMLIARVRYSKSIDGGEITQMTLRREDAYKKLIKKAVRKGTTNTYGW